MWGDPKRNDTTKVHRPQLHTGTGARYTRLGSLKTKRSPTELPVKSSSPSELRNEQR